MDIFADVVRANHQALLGAVVRAAHQLGVFGLLHGSGEAGAISEGEMAKELGLPSRRLSRLLDILVAEGILRRGPQGRIHHRTREEGGGTEPVPLPGEEKEANALLWDRLADVIASGKPVELDPEWLGGHLSYLNIKGLQAGPPFWDAVQPDPGERLLDLGGGLGPYSLTYLARDAGNTALLLDLPETLLHFQGTAAAGNPRLDTLAGDARDLTLEAEFDLVLLANLLHLFGPEDCRRIIRSAVRATRPGGRVVIRDLTLSRDRRKPLVSLYFALNMALFTDEGDVYPSHQLRGWMEEAGLSRVHEIEVAALPGALVVVGTREDS